MRLKTAGTDPEILFSDGEVFRSVVGRLPGTKSDPYPVRNGAVQVDCVCGEFNTKPVSSPLSFSTVVDEVHSQMTEMVGGLLPTQASAGYFQDSELMSAEARLSGCSVDWNAYSRTLNDPADYSQTSMRCAGGHLHFGVGCTPAEIVHLVKVADLLIVVPMLLHEDPSRRAIYGKAGSFRVKPYGFEHRTPSNFWVFTEDRRRWVFNQMEKVIQTGMDIETPLELEEVINFHDVQAAERMVSAFNLTPIPA